MHTNKWEGDYVSIKQNKGRISWKNMILKKCLQVLVTFENMHTLTITLTLTDTHTYVNFYICFTMI